MDFLLYILLLLCGGCFSGLMAGLLGVGGGIIITPIQYNLMLMNGVEASIALPMSFATSLAVIFVTMINSSQKHYKNGMIEKTGLGLLMIFGVIGAVSGALISTTVNVRYLEIFFGIVCIFSAINMIVLKYPENDDNINKNSLAHGLLGLIAGLLSGLMGVGGGVIMIPALTILFKYPTRKAIGTSSAAIIATSLGGIIAYIILGQGVVGLPSFSIGYVNILQFVFIAITSTLISGYAAKLSQKINTKYLKALQVVLVLYIGLNMLRII
ncbi:MAG: sulfite exporter TauE/SafE family protein [Methanosphaera sp.]|uniref:sulfite exporter TauE/SafE family protein n=1 Tax=Methanosphaera sp. TaxID=2666342 RepID=UPI0025EEF30E|nr:sulfite exporter TauE/SafE family protein [Methanosphaera sp.]MCI5867791.1 sulfite exporter TauE/SafE family protein [Methanosphaera sp.]MDD6535250.1 sulfite exporter TauE/SafE family protein [Methanosphaera sp.]MDY3956411.1 sulfite exporter TauE/SafE family protein [Methanosphaera sp.]